MAFVINQSVHRKKKKQLVMIHYTDVVAMNREQQQGRQAGRCVPPELTMSLAAMV